MYIFVCMCVCARARLCGHQHLSCVSCHAMYYDEISIISEKDIFLHFIHTRTRARAYREIYLSI